MDIERRTLCEGMDSWEGEMTYQGMTYKVEVDQVDNQNWQMEVLIDRGGCSFLGTHFGLIEPLHYSLHPTLQAALDAAADYIRGSYPEAESTQKV